MRLGLLGGTFNPIHNGHLAIARHTREALGLDRILLIPTGDPPHKPDDILAPAKDRYEMVKLAAQQEPGLAVSDIEIRRVGKSYTVDTIHSLIEQYGNETELFFIIGIDAFLEFPSWKHPEELLRSCNFVVVSRPGSTFTPLVRMPPLASIMAASPSTCGKDLHERMAKLSQLDVHQRHRLDIPVSEDKSVVLLDLPPCEISASDIRAKLRQGLPVANLLPPLVESYIIHHHLY
ncbi:MAG TPA: nicotinate-nucleotide adenylyltransferase [Nitrospira sp.]